MFTTRDKILLALEQAPNGLLSGAALAARLGLTRASVWKHVKALRSEGFPIRTRKASGYALTAPFDFSLLKGEVGRDLGFWKIHYQFATPSTQLLAKHAAEQNAPEGHFWIVEKQTAGRGRLDRSWESDLGGIWMSLLLRPAIPPALVPSLPLVTALALTEAIQSATGLSARLKWPNDVVVKTPAGWRKVAGILTEMSAEVDRARWVVIGIGINVNNRLSPGLKTIGATLSALTGRQLSRAELLKHFLDHFGKTYRRFEKAGFAAFQSLYWQRYSRPNEPVKLKTSQGLVRGIARGVDGQGALVVEFQNQTRSFWEGEIVL